MALNKDLVSNIMPPQMLTALMQALLNGTISRRRFDFNLRRGEIAEPGVSFEEEQAEIELDQAQQPLVTVASPFTPPPTPVPAGQNGAPPPRGG